MFSPTDAAAALDAAAGKRIPILMYHCVAETAPASLPELYVKPSELAKQLQYLQDNGFQTLTFEDLPHIRQYAKPVMLTFDDGYADNYTNLFPLLKQYNAKATIFVTAGNVKSGSNYLDAAMIREMADSGLVSIQSHTVTHPELPDISAAALQKELADSQTQLEALSGKPVIALAYPNGDSDPAVRAAAARYYAFGLNKSGGAFTCGDDLFTMKRLRVSRSTTLGEFQAMVG